MEQKFCRVCGMNLDAVSKALAAHGLPFAAEDSHAATPLYSWRHLMKWGVIITFAGIFIGVIGKKFIHDDIVSGVGAMIALAGIFLICFSSLATLGTGKKPRQAKEATAPDRAKPTVPLQLELLPASVSSVAERTTELLEVEPLKVSAHKRD
jgi:hypothetical protein